MTPGGYDLHVHSTRSDGMLPPRAVVELAAEAGLEGLALTDHDTTDGWAEAADACEVHGLVFVPGIELSAEEDDFSVHLLGYFVDGADPGLVAECARLRGERERRARVMVERLAALGAPVAWERVAALAGDAPVGRPHVAAALVETGAVGDLDEAFRRYLGDGGPAWEPKRALDPVRAVRLLRAAGGVAVLAHPGCTRLAPGSLQRMVEAGLAGVECRHPGHEPQNMRDWQELAKDMELVATGASDFHGGAKAVKIGEHTTTAVELDQLRRRRDDARRAGQRHPGRTRSW